jgi:hypothetical protein
VLVGAAGAVGEPGVQVVLNGAAAAGQMLVKLFSNVSTVQPDKTARGQGHRVDLKLRHTKPASCAAEPRSQQHSAISSAPVGLDLASPELGDKVRQASPRAARIYGQAVACCASCCLCCHWQSAAGYPAACQLVLHFAKHNLAAATAGNESGQASPCSTPGAWTPGDGGSSGREADGQD